MNDEYEMVSNLKTNPDEEASQNVAVIIPCYRETSHILDVVAGIGPEVNTIYIIDDKCPDNTGAFVKAQSDDKRIRVIYHEQNMGVGGATISGYVQAHNDGHSIFVKMDGDGQMDGRLISRLIAPIIRGDADYAKGNRFNSIRGIADMPWQRILGNFALSLASKFSSGYWNILDPTNGFTALHSTALDELPLERISKGYFFESHMLYYLGIARAVVYDMPMTARYGTERSGIDIPKIVPEFLIKHLICTWRRLIFTYFIREINIATIELLLAALMIIFGIMFGGYNWAHAYFSKIPATAGTVILAALPIILGFQFLIAFLNFDGRNVPKLPLQRLLSK